MSTTTAFWRYGVGPMSTGKNCLFIEEREGRWYYLLQDRIGPSGKWDWRLSGTAYGPFPSLEEGRRSLRTNHPNPGGYSVARRQDVDQDEVLDRILEGAWTPTAEGAVRSPGGNVVIQGPTVQFLKGIGPGLVSRNKEGIDGP